MASTVNPSNDNISIPTPSQEPRSSTTVRPLEPFDGITDAVNEAAPQTAQDEHEYPTGAKFWLVAASVSLVIVLGGMDASIVATAVPSITDHFHTVADVGWYSAAYRLSVCSFQFMFGKSYKLFPIKPIFLMSVCIFLVGSVICATANSSHTFVLGRAVTGLGACGVISGCFTLLVQIVPLRKRPLFTAMFGSIEFMAVVAGPLLGGILTEELSWRWCFYINLPTGGVILLVLSFLFSSPRASGGEGMTLKEKLVQLDLIGNLVFLPCLTCFFIAITWAGTKYPWSNWRIILLLSLFAVLFATFVYDQIRKGDKATIPPRILKQRSVLAGFIFIVCTSSSGSVLEYYMPTYFQAVLGYSPSHSGYMMLPVIIGTMLGMVVNGAGTSIVGYYTPFMLVGSVMMPIFIGLVTTWQLHTQLVNIIMYAGLAGFSIGVGFMGPQSGVQTALSDSDAPLGVSVIIFAQNFGPAVFQTVSHTIFTNRLSTNLQHLAPGLNATTIEGMGLSDLKTHIGPQNLQGVLVGFDKSIVQTWYLVIGLACTTLIGSVAMEWKSVKQKKS